ncbi:protein MHF2 homolog isoform X2 [Henckelia pumila]|uniref:protein MHF2 homolog isoform X2 n=1 Tax=Henckelia pumila TaxID=405737 RepID=UPI003C6E8867
MEEHTFDPDLIREIFELVWRRTAAERDKNENSQNVDSEAGASTSKKKGFNGANPHALKLSCELLRIFVTAIQRAAAIAEIEGSPKIEATHLERILPQLLLDF